MSSGGRRTGQPADAGGWAGLEVVNASPEGDMLSAAVGRLARMFRYPPEEEPSIRRVPVRFLVVALVVGLVIWLPVRYT